MRDGNKEVVQLVFTIFETTKLANELRYFWKECKIGSRSAVPFVDGCGRENTVVKSIHLNSIKLGRVVRKFIFGALSIKAFEFGLGPPGAAYVYLRLEMFTLAAIQYSVGVNMVHRQPKIEYFWIIYFAKFQGVISFSCS